MKTPIGIVGAGAWGSALAYGLSKRMPVLLYNHEPRKTSKLKSLFTRKKAKVRLTLKIEQVFNQCETIILCVPFQILPQWFSIHSRVYPMHKHIFINASKGISADTFQLFPQMISPDFKIGVLSGPSFADELLSDQPTTLVFASKHPDICKDFQISASHGFLRIYIQHDPIGVSVGGALKNVLAIASGIAHGQGLQKNAIGALVTRGVWEIAHLAKFFGGQAKTVFGLSGLGDILLSCYSNKSRNMRFGQLIGKGKSVRGALKSINSTVEGYATARGIYQFLKQNAIEAPICEEVFYILYKDKPPKRSLKELMRRPLKPEIFP